MNNTLAINQQRSLLLNPSLWIVLLFGFSSGLPLALTGATLQAWFAVSQIDLITIGLLSLVGQPYIYKFLWAPLFDRYPLPFLGRRRGWLLVTQIALLISIACMAMYPPATHAHLLTWLALLTAFFSASQDIVVDAYRTEILSSETLGVGAAMYTAGYRVAMLISGGLALVLADHIGWHNTYLIMAALMLGSIVCTFISKEPAQEPQHIHREPFLAAIIAPWRELWSREHIIAILFFILLYKLGEAFTVSLTSVFLLKGLGFSLTSVGAVYKTVSFVATLLGVFAGGVLLMRTNLYRSLLFCGILQALSILTYMALALVGQNYLMMVTSVFAENFCAGMATDVFVAFIMRFCTRRYTASQFALLAALAACGRVFSGPIAAMLINEVGWADFFFLSFIIALPGLVLLYYLRTTIQKIA